MAHSNNIISSIKLPNGNTYEIHDAQAIHDVSELGISGALIFKGTISDESRLPTASATTVGHVYLNTSDNTEYVGVQNGSEYSWEKLGNIHDAASSSHTHSVTVAGSNAASAVSGTITVPVVSNTTKYMAANVTRDDVTTDNALGENATFTTTVAASTANIKVTATDVAISGDGTANAITGFGAHTTGTALSTDATFSVSGGAVTTSKMEQTSVSKVSNSGSTTGGTAAAWTASVDANGVLSFDWMANTPTAVTLPTFTSVNVATGALASDGTGSEVATGIGTISVSANDSNPVNAITALGTPTTATALTGVKVTAQPTVKLSTSETTGDGIVSVATGINSATTSVNNKDAVAAVTSVPVPAVTLSGEANSGTGRVAFDTVSVTTGPASHNLTAAAQTWTQGNTTVGAPQ